MQNLLNDFSLGLFAISTFILICLMLLLRKFAWKPILAALDARESGIQNALDAAEQAKNEMSSLKSENANLLAKANAERDAIIKDAKEVATQMIESANNDAKLSAGKFLETARKTIQEEKAAAISELKTQVASISLEIAEKVIRGELSNDDKQKALAEKLASDINMN